MAKWVYFGPLFFNLIRLIQLCDKKNLTFVDCWDKIILNSSWKMLSSSPKARLITFSKSRLILFYFNSLLMTDPLYIKQVSFPLCRDFVDRWILVSEEEIAQAVFYVLDNHHKVLLTLSLLLTTKEAFVDSVDQNQTAQNVRSDLLSTLSTLVLQVIFITPSGVYWNQLVCLSICVSVCVQNTSFYQSAGGGMKSHLATALVWTVTVSCSGTVFVAIEKGESSLHSSKGFNHMHCICFQYLSHYFWKGGLMHLQKVSTKVSLHSLSRLTSQNFFLFVNFLHIQGLFYPRIQPVKRQLFWLNGMEFYFQRYICCNVAGSTPIHAFLEFF